MLCKHDVESHTTEPVPELFKLKKCDIFLDNDREFSADAFICPECGLEAGTVQSAGDIQRAIADAYRKKDWHSYRTNQILAGGQRTHATTIG